MDPEIIALRKNLNTFSTLQELKKEVIKMSI